MTGNRSMMLRVAAAIGYVIMVVVNGLAVTLPINGVETDEVSDRYSNLFAPAGFTFSIWGVIYTLLGVYTVYQVFRRSDLIDAVAPWFLLTSLLNALWILLWHYDRIGFSVLVMLGILYGLIRVVDVVRTVGLLDGLRDYLILRAPFSVYFGWICIATVANISAYLVSLGFRGIGFSQEYWMVGTVIAAAAIGLTAILVNRDVAYGLVFVWAYWGILSKHRSPTGWDGRYDAVITTVTVLILVLAAGAALGLWRDLAKSGR